MSDDAAILRHYVATRSQTAFAELVQRHLSLVYAVALRQVGGDAHLAEDVAQHVFVSLARKAGTLTDRATLAGWLYRSTHFAASDVVRAERRRRAREQEAHSMHPDENIVSSSIIASGSVDWEAVRPTIDAAIAELGERDRDAVWLRFFENRSYADVGERLKLTENAARMRVERALDKLHAALSRRGVTSTSAALGLALANQAVGSVPTGLAATITSAAMTGSAVGTLGVLSFVSAGKLAAGLGAGVTVAALGVVGWQYLEKSTAQGDGAGAGESRLVAQADLAAMRARLDAAERRSREAKKDHDALLKAAERASASVATPDSSILSAVTATTASPSQGWTTEVDARLAQERAYQQQLAKRRAEEAMARAKIDSEAAQDPDPAARYQKLIEAAEKYAANADFPAAIRASKLALEMKPDGMPITDRLLQLQFALRDQHTPVEMTLVSDGLTHVSLMGPYGQRPPAPLQTATLKVMPANYEVIGRRDGFQDVRIPVEVRGGVPAPVVQIACTVPVAPKG